MCLFLFSYVVFEKKDLTKYSESVVQILQWSSFRGNVEKQYVIHIKIVILYWLAFEIMYYWV